MKRTCKLYFSVAFLFINFFAVAQNKQFTVKYINSPIKVDAVLDEDVWQTADVATNFWQQFPTDSLQAKAQTEIKMLFDDDNLYVGIKVNAKSNKFIVPSLRRDFRAGGSDNITLMFDTFNDATNAFIFGSNPYGVLREILLANGGTQVRDFDGSWDVKWQGESKIHDTYYICEWAIPLYAFKYREGETKWRFNSYQFDTQYNERNTWINIPQNQFIFSLAYMGDMYFEKPLGKSKSPISIIPYINTSALQDFEEDVDDTDFKIGGDAKFTIGNSLNLDLTINPDFSQVEVDRQITNLTRFSIALPERRQFFIENSDLFGNFGDFRESRAFFSRRIGIAKDLDDETIENRIIAGARISGKLNNNFRIGLLNMQTEEDEVNEIAATNNAVLALQHKIFSRSNLSFLFINKQATKEYAFLNDNDDDTDNNTYNRVIGLDYNLASKNNTWTGKYYLHKSITPNSGTKDFSSGATTQFNSRYIDARVSGVYIGDDYRSELGFIRRTDIFKATLDVELKFWPKKGIFNRHSLTFLPITIFRPDALNFGVSDRLHILRWESNFNNQSEISFSMNHRFTKLVDDPFDPTDTDGALELPQGSEYDYTDYEIEYESDQRKIFSYSLNPSYGTFYNGEKFSFQGRATLRLQPYFVASAQVRYDKIDLPDPYPDASIWLVGPRFDVTFNKKLFWTTLVQYSNQNDNMGINSRLQWRFKPLSDLFIVYNDNYFVNSFAPKVRSLTLKFTYWLNI